MKRNLDTAMETHVKMEKAIPVFLGMIGSLACCALMAAISPGFRGFFSPKSESPVLIKETARKDPSLFFVESHEENDDLVRELLQRQDTRGWVIGYFAQVCGSWGVAAAILDNAAGYEIPSALAFALCWEESRFNPRAVNQKNVNGSIDRGLFQLNSSSFPNLQTQAFFNIATNARLGMSHLRHCLDEGKTEIAGLAMYNAGTGRVRSIGTPKSTLDYVHRILENRRRIETQFKAQLLDQLAACKTGGNPAPSGIDEDWVFSIDEFSESLAAAEKPRRARLSLSPL
jgi:hypothetical protein